MHIAVVGCGYWGPNLIRNLNEIPECRKVTCCDINQKKLDKIKTRFPDSHAIRDFQEVLKNPEIKGVVIATSVSSHFPLAKQAIESGKHVFIEKPMTASTKEAEELLQIAAKNQKIIMVGHTFLFSPPVIKIKQIIANGDLGKIFYISTTRVNLGLHQKDVSVIWDLAPHDFSMLFYWLDETPLRVWSIGKDYIIKGIPDVSFVTMEFSSGTLAHLQISWLSPSKLRRTAIVGSEKMLVYDDIESVEKVKVFDKGVDFKDPETFGEFQLSYRSGDIWSPKLDTFEPLRSEMTAFLKAIETGKVEKSDGQAGLQVVKVLEAAEKSLMSNGQVISIS